MTLFTDNPFEKMMIQKPDYGKREKSPPSGAMTAYRFCRRNGSTPLLLTRKSNSRP